MIKHAIEAGAHVGDKRRVADVAGSDVDEGEELGRLSLGEFAVAMEHLVALGESEGGSLGFPTEIPIEPVRPQVGVANSPGVEGGAVGGAPVRFDGADVIREGCVGGVDEILGVGEDAWGLVSISQDPESHVSERSRSAVAIGGELAGVVTGVQLPGDVELAEIIDATGAKSLGFGLAQGWELKGRQDSDDGDHDQQFDQCEGWGESWEAGDWGKGNVGNVGNVG